MFFFHKRWFVLEVVELSIKSIRVMLACFLMTTPVASNGSDPLHGQWGSAKQCAKAPIADGGARLAAPFILGADWLAHGEIWCRLRWLRIASDRERTEATVRAVCGEDDARDYHIDMVLAENLLTLTWDRWLVNGPLKRCKK